MKMTGVEVFTGGIGIDFSEDIHRFVTQNRVEVVNTAVAMAYDVERNMMMQTVAVTWHSGFDMHTEEWR